ncbi:hypothetical protein [Pyxidicoccus trucidator]|uniref:hypothetical protein n=1 Tax=Pyxidicoccus trucidator TaxID=2709662 RepID=UPI0013DAB8CB|nr:hypothetical protein [Pyxidicoccus trucidator]
MDRLVEWIGPIGLSVLPAGENSERPYFGVRRKNGAIVKRKQSLPYSFSFTWLNVKSAIILVSEREVRLVTSLTARALFGYVFGAAGALLCALSLMPGILLKIVAVLILGATLFVLLAYNRTCIVRESELLRRALEEIDGDNMKG